MQMFGNRRQLLGHHIDTPILDREQMRDRQAGGEIRESWFSHA